MIAFDLADVNLKNEGFEAFVSVGEENDWI